MRKEIHWGSPKYWQNAWNKFTQRNGMRRANYCKKLKGKHDYEHIGYSASTILLDEVWEHWMCRGCGKQKLKIVKV